MGKDRLESYFKNKLSEHKIHVDKDELWDHLDLQEKKAPRSSRLILLPFIILSITAAGGWCLLSNSNNQNHLVSEQKVEKYQSISNTSNESETSEITHIETPATEQYQSKKNAKSQLDIEKSLVKSEPEGNSKNNKRNTETNHRLDLNSQSNPFDESQINKQQDNSAYRLTQNTSASNQILDQAAGTIIADKLQSNKEKTVSRVLLKDRVISPQIFTKSTTKKTDAPRELVSAFSKLPIRLESLVSPTRGTLDLGEKQLAHQKRGHGLMLYLGGGYYNNLRQLESEDPLNQNTLSLVESRKATEQSLESIRLDVSLKKQLNDNFYLRSGLSFKSINERFSYTDTEFNGAIFDTLAQKIIFHAQGDSTIIFGNNISGILVSNYKYQYINNHRLVQIPLVMGYQFGKNDWTGFLELGIIAGIRSFDGSILDMEGNVDSNAIEYKNSAVFGYHLALGIEHQITSNISVYLSADHQSYISNFASQTYGIKHRYGNVGINMGIGYRLK